MRLGMNMLLWTDQVDESHLPIIERLAKIGFNGIEIPVFAGDAKHYQKLGKRLADLGLGATAIMVVDGDHNPISPQASVRAKASESIKAGIDRSAAVGAKVLCGPLHSALGVFSGQSPTSAEFDWSTHVLRGAGDHAKAAGVTLAVEFLNRFETYLVTTMAEAVRLIDAINHPAVGVMFDTFHAHIEEKDPIVALNLPGKRLVHVHLSENDRGTPGTGQVGWHEVMRALRAQKYDGWMMIESFSRALPNLAAATRVWRDLAPSLDDVAIRGHQFLRSAWEVAE